MQKERTSPGALEDVRDRIDVQVVHHVARIVVDLDIRMADLADDLAAGLTRAGCAAVLLDDDHHAAVGGDRVPAS